MREIVENTLSESVKALEKANVACGELALLSGENLAGGLLAISEAISNNSGSLSKSISTETGMALKSAREDAALASLEFRTASHQLFSSLAEKQTIPVDPFDNLLMAFNFKSPLGVIVMFASPLENISHSAKVIANAISTGNPVVCVASPMAPGPFEELKSAMEASGLPKDLFQLLILQEDSKAIRAILKNKSTGAVVLSGRESEFGHVLKQATGIRTLIACKTASPVIIWDDADLDAAAEYVAASAFSGYNGCYSAAGKIILREDSYEYFRNRLIELASRIVVGNAGEEDTDMGPLPDEEYIREAAKQLEEAVIAGASVAFGGAISGAFFPPTIVEYVPPGSPLLTGIPHVPLICLERVNSMDEAIGSANAFGNHVQASVFTSDIDLATSAAEKLEFSNILINEAPGSFSGFWEGQNSHIEGLPQLRPDLRKEFSRTKIVKFRK